MTKKEKVEALVKAGHAAPDGNSGPWIDRRYYVRPRAGYKTGWEVVKVIERDGVEDSVVWTKAPSKLYGKVLALRKNDALRRAGTYRAAEGRR